MRYNQSENLKDMYGKRQYLRRECRLGRGKYTENKRIDVQ